jgi:hypothetical protein
MQGSFVSMLNFSINQQAPMFIWMVYQRNSEQFFFLFHWDVVLLKAEVKAKLNTETSVFLFLNHEQLNTVEKKIVWIHVEQQSESGPGWCPMGSMLAILCILQQDKHQQW